MFIKHNQTLYKNNVFWFPVKQCKMNESATMNGTTCLCVVFLPFSRDFDVILNANLKAPSPLVYQAKYFIMKYRCKLLS